MAESRVQIGSDKILRVNGAPFFPIGARHMPAGGSTKHLKAAGFNCMRWLAFGAGPMPRTAGGILDDLSGLMFYTYIYDRGDFSEEREKRSRELTDIVNRVKGHPAFLCYEQRNEPACTVTADIRDRAHQPQSPPEGMIEASRLIRKLDPDHPIRLGHMTCNLVSTLKKYNEATDMVGCNPYPVLHPEMRPTVRVDGKYVDSPNQTISTMGEYTTKMMRVGEGRPVWMQLQAHANEHWFKEKSIPYDHHVLYPSYSQMRFMAFHAIVRGATAFEWSMTHLSVEDPAWANVCRIIGQLQELHDVLVSPVSPKKIRTDYKELGYSDWTGVETMVKLRKGKPWLMAVNTQFDPMEATFSHLPEGISNSLIVIDEGREVKVKGNSFSDYFRPYEVHVYGPSDTE